MFCPRCGSSQSEELKFCKACGANLAAVRQAVDGRENEQFDWTRTWAAQMFMSRAELQRRKAEIERQAGITPDVKRYNEIKAGVITSCAGIGISIFLYALMQGIILGGKVPNDTAEILSRIWVAGIIPIFVGIALMINGMFVSKKQAEVMIEAMQDAPPLLEHEAGAPALRSADTSEFVPANYSVTEGTTKHLRSEQKG